MADSIFKRAGEALGIIEKAAPTETLGTTRESGGVLTGEGAGTFYEPNRELNITGSLRFDEYDRIVRDIAIIGAGVRLFLNLISNAVWSVNPPEGLSDNEQGAAQGYADQAYADLFAMTSSWSSVVRKTAAFRFIGFAILEWTAKKKEDGSIGFLDIEHRPQRSITRWLRDEGGTVEAVVQRVPGRQDVTLPRSKIVYAVDDTLTDSPEGIGLFRHMLVTARRLELFLQLEEIGFTTDLRGIPIARAPLEEMAKAVEDAGPIGSDARARAEAKRVASLSPLRDFLNKHIRNEKTGGLFSSATYMAEGVDKAKTPSQVRKWSLELLNGESQSFEAMSKSIDRMNQELARLMGVEHLLLGADGSGSLALGRSKMGAFYLQVTSTLLDLLEIFDRDVIAPWADLNGVPEELRPQMGVNEISDRDLEQVTAALKDLATAGAPVLPDDPAVMEIYDLLGLARPPERIDEMDLSLNPGRTAPTKKEPANDDDLAQSREDRVAKRAKVLRSRQNTAKGRSRKR